MSRSRASTPSTDAATAAINLPDSRQGPISSSVSAAQMRCLVVMCMLLGGCALARVNEPPHMGYAMVAIPRLPNGEPSIYVFQVESKHRVLSQPIEQPIRASLSSVLLKPGSYVVEIECERPGAGVVLHGGIDLDISVQADALYVLDCSPTRDATYNYAENNFALSKQP